MQPRVPPEGQEVEVKLDRALAALAEARSASQRREEQAVEEVTAGVAELTAAKQRLQDEVLEVTKQLAAAKKELSKLQRDLQEAEAERNCLTGRCNDKIQDAERQIGTLQQQVAALSRQLKQGTQQQQQSGQQHQPSLLSSFWGIRSGGVVDCAPAGPQPSLGAQPGCGMAAAASPAAVAALPPVLQLDPAQLLAGVDLHVGFTRADIAHAVHQFAACLHDTIDRKDLIDGPAAALIELMEKAAIPDGAVKVIGAHRLEAEKAAFLGHSTMHWLSNNLWVDPLGYLDASVRLGVPGTKGTNASEANLVALLQSHAARSWLPTVERILQLCDGADSISSIWRELQQQQHRDPAATSVLNAVAKAADGLAGWFRLHHSLATVVKGTELFCRVLLRALHLGLFVLAAHPRLRLFVSTPLVNRKGGAVPLSASSQDVRRRMQFVGQPEFAKRSGTQLFLLCSVQPGVRYDATATTEVGPGGGGEVDAGMLPEEVVAWAWAASGASGLGSEAAPRERRRSSVGAQQGNPLA